MRPPAALVLLVLSVTTVAVVSLRHHAFFVPCSSSSTRTPTVIVARVFALGVFAHRSILVFLGPAVRLEVRYFAGSAFAERSISLKAWSRLATFTVQSWVLEGLYFAGALAGASWAPILFGVVFATSHLVSAITTHVLIPIAASTAKREGYDVRDSILFSNNALILHNANVGLVHLDMLASGQTMHAAHTGAAVLWAAWYICFAWALAARSKWLPYPFIDFTLPLAKSIPIHLGIAVLLAGFFLTGVAFSSVLKDWGLPARLTAHALLLRLVTRFR